MNGPYQSHYPLQWLLDSTKTKRSILVLFVLGGMMSQAFAASDLPRKYATLKSAQIVQKAEKGDPNAQYELRFRYARGYKNEIKQDKPQAAKWYRLAAESGHVLGMRDLAYVLTTSGKGVEIDYEEGFKWYSKAVESGDIDFMCRLGNAYRSGWGTQMDKAQAAHWYGAAAKQGHQLAPFYILAMHLLREHEFSPEDIFIYASNAAADKLPVRGQFGTRSEEPGDRVAQRILGDLYKSGTGTPRNLSAAIKWYKKAAEQSDVQAQVSLASMYEDGQGVAKSPQQAFKWYYDAATSDVGKAPVSRRSLLDTGSTQGNSPRDPTVVAAAKAEVQRISGPILD